MVIKRFLAFVIDYLLIAGYGFLLFGIAMLIGPEEFTPLISQLVGFLTLTLPVFLYFFLMERSRFRATLGKRFMNLSVNSDLNRFGQRVFIRNIVKFIPWEIAHIGVHWIVYYTELDHDPPLWVWTTLIFPQLIIIVYVISIVMNKGERSFYDKLAGTKIGVGTK